MSIVLLPITLTTASVLALFFIFLTVRVVRGRFINRVSLGDGGNKDMVVRMRTHANFGEYVPIILILMALLELAGGSPLVLTIFGVALVIARVMHFIGMPRRAPNFFRAGGTIATLLVLLATALYGLILTWFAWSPMAA